MANRKRRTPEEITDTLYAVYGSDAGYLFGIPPDLRHTVDAIVKKVVEIVSRQMQKGGTNGRIACKS